ncbi:hypothetical protein [Erwinia mallotivora]|uniref:Uncharacterized protein n=1 Tax=Erwinia mallotivora TaxID=69222 RepID=A0A014MD54_9GAMM|nr:hypothetical protein [Erwinia mallotivora]EXU75999.1 hypothetical protein BG55_08010 [Erwinia mallotivora]
MSIKNYPMVRMNQRNFLLSVKPEWHTRLFPDSILNNEDESIIKDVSHTNSIHKVYLAGMKGMDNLQAGDNLLIYRTTDQPNMAYYRAVATSVCVVEEYKNINEFSSIDEFKSYCAPYSVFTDSELGLLYRRKNYPHVVKFSYNFPLKKRIIRKELMEITGYDNSNYWGFLRLSDAHLRAILEAGEVNESLIVN